MNILVIGNGFDLAHGLPTHYDEFLDFCEKTRRIFTYRENLNENEPFNIDNWKINDYIKDILLKAFAQRDCIKNLYDDGTYDLKIKTPNNSLNELYDHINKNIWIQYFLYCRSYIGKNWIDFESEISNVIQILDELRNLLKKGYRFGHISREKQKILRILSLGKQIEYDDIKVVEDLVCSLNTELERLIRALEIYIVEFVGGIAITKRNSDIEKLNPDHILSFNYSDTYEKIYGKDKNIEYAYIHGKADINKNVKNSDLVLGIDEYLEDGEKDKELVFLTFKKFYQRIYKSTGNTYLNWVDEIKDGYSNYLNSLSYNEDFPEHTLYIFGHSLDVTDKDVLKMFICNDNVQTKIFYYRENEDDKRELGKLIRNLILVMGPEELIRRTGGVHKTIEFVPQSL